MAVLYTTHYMEEAERLCDRIGIVDLGELKAEGTRAELVALVGEHDRVRLEGAGDLDGGGAGVRTRSSAVRAASVRGRRHRADRRRRAQRAARAAPGGRRRPASPSASVEVDEPDLEAVFLHLTGKALRD